MQSSWLELLQQYPHPFLLFVAVFLLSGSVTMVMYRQAVSRQLLPSIRERDVHTVRKPRLGGIAMWIAVIITFFVLVGFPGTNALLDFHRVHYFGIDISLWGIIGGMAVILGVGLLDDIRGLGPGPQALGQLAAALMLIAAGVRVPYIRLPFNEVLVLSAFWSSAFTVIWVMLVMNVMNFFDGLDGLAGSVSFTASVVLFLVSMRTGFLATATLSIIIAGASSGFLPWNWYPSKLFMGTVGSQMLGFLLGVVAIISGGKVATAVLVLGIPLLDAIVVVARRLMAHQSPFKADLRHLHHRLLKIGLPTPWVVMLINGVSVIFGFLAFSTQQSSVKAFLTLVLVACMALFIFITYILEHRLNKPVD
jgi:UDP-GlcNAc:undecaprenyl-phosphate GlcNAc-1-phosphate transferase